MNIPADLREYAHSTQYECRRDNPASCTGCFVRDVLGVPGDAPGDDQVTNRTVTGVRLEMAGPVGSTGKPRWVAEAYDVEANVTWFEASGPTPIDAVTRLADLLLAAHARQGWELTELKGAIEDGHKRQADAR